MRLGFPDAPHPGKKLFFSLPAKIARTLVSVPIYLSVLIPHPGGKRWGGISATPQHKPQEVAGGGRWKADALAVAARRRCKTGS
jgi:hypothetical protein